MNPSQGCITCRAGVRHATQSTKLVERPAPACRHRAAHRAAGRRSGVAVGSPESLAGCSACKADVSGLPAGAGGHWHTQTDRKPTGAAVPGPSSPICGCTHMQGSWVQTMLALEAKQSQWQPHSSLPVGLPGLPAARSTHVSVSSCRGRLCTASSMSLGAVHFAAQAAGCGGAGQIECPPNWAVGPLPELQPTKQLSNRHETASRKMQPPRAATQRLPLHLLAHGTHLRMLISIGQQPQCCQPPVLRGIRSSAS